jgi:cell division protease FtsH
VSRGQALGLTISLPTEDRYMQTTQALLEEIAMTLGGRAAEELVFSEVTTGAADDLEKVTRTAKQMIMRFGMSEKLGPRVLGHNRDMPFLGREMSNEPDYSEEVAREIDDEIRRVIEEAQDVALSVLREHMEELHRLSQILSDRETIDRDQFERLLAGEDESTVFLEDAPGVAAPKPHEEPRGEEKKHRPIPQPRPFPLPGTLAAGLPVASPRPPHRSRGHTNGRA